MVILDQYESQIERFIQSSVERFKMEIGSPSSVGIYCCPWAGWLTSNFNLSKTLQEAYSNCPDFEFVEFDCLDLAEWQKEYETDTYVFKISDTNTENIPCNLHDLHTIGRPDIRMCSKMKSFCC